MNTRAKTMRIAVAAATIGLAAAGAAMAASRLGLHGDPSHTAGGPAPGAFVDSGSGSSGIGSGPRFGGRGSGPGLRHDDLADAAAYLGISESALQTQLQSGKTLAQIADATAGKSAAGLVDALVAAESKEIDAAVNAGSLTRAQADRLQANLKAHETAEVNGTFRGRGGPGFGHGGGPRGHLSAAAAYLGMPVGDLTSKLQSGKTLGAIAEETPGKSKAGLIAALVAHEQASLARAVKDGRLTQAQADRIGADLEQRIADLVNGTFRGPDDHGPMPGAPGPPGGPSPGGGTASSPLHV